MNWQDLERRIATEILAKQSVILKADGKGLREVTSNRNRKIGMRTGKDTKQSKAITYDMIKYAFEVIAKTGRFDSQDFRRKYDKEYIAAPCRFSMTGGILVKFGIVRIIPVHDGENCQYIRVD